MTSESSATPGDAQKASQLNGERFHGGQASTVGGAAALSLSYASPRPPTSGAHDVADHQDHADDHHEPLDEVVARHGEVAAEHEIDAGEDRHHPQRHV